jgi:hypothetical protein
VTIFDNHTLRGDQVPFQLDGSWFTSPWTGTGQGEIHPGDKYGEPRVHVKIMDRKWGSGWEPLYVTREAGILKLYIWIDDPAGDRFWWSRTSK